MADEGNGSLGLHGWPHVVANLSAVALMGLLLIWFVQSNLSQVKESQAENRGLLKSLDVANTIDMQRHTELLLKIDQALLSAKDLSQTVAKELRDKDDEIVRNQRKIMDHLKLPP